MISNIHTHTIYCDGQNTPEEMVQQALQEGFTALGFSGHSHCPFDPSCPGMNPKRLTAYRNEIKALQAKYDDKIRLYTGIEQDFETVMDDLDFDYRIGSIHYMKGPDRYYPIDSSGEKLLELIHDLYEGDSLAFVRAYCEKELVMMQEKRPDVIGHFDLYRKFNDQLHYLDESDPAYQKLAESTLHEMLSMGALFELNLGAMIRGLTKEPYPSVRLLSFLQKEKARLIITTDCHRASMLASGYDKAITLLRDLGFSSMIVMGKNGFQEVSVDSSSSSM